MAVLPHELLREVASHMDRRSLAAFVRASSLFWEIGTPYLYRKLTVNGRELRRMFMRAGGRPLRRGEKVECPAPEALGRRTRKRLKQEHRRYALALGGSLPPRFRRALGCVEELELRPPFLPRVIHMVWDAAAEVPNQPLFANVKRLQIGTERREDDFPPPIGPPIHDRVLLFDSPHVCITNSRYAVRFLDTLPSKSYDICCHYAFPMDLAISHVLDDGLPKACGKLRVFCDYVDELSDPERVVDGLVDLENALEGIKNANAYAYVCLRSPEHDSRSEHPSLVDTLDSEHSWEQWDDLFAGLRTGGWRPEAFPRVTITVPDPAVDKESERPCTVCGGSELISSNRQARDGLHILMDSVSEHRAVRPLLHEPPPTVSWAIRSVIKHIGENAIHVVSPLQISDGQ